MSALGHATFLSERQGEGIIKNFDVNNNLYHQGMTIDARIKELERKERGYCYDNRYTGGQLWV
ncbi:MAG: hypothetical protein WB564_02100 [Dehalococcoidia bacterium]